MPRSNNKYPDWNRLQIDPEIYPGDYWTRGSRKCTECNIGWGNYDWLTNLCPECDHPLVIDTEDTPTVTWRTTVSSGLSAAFERYYLDWNEGVDDESLTRLEDMPLPIDSEVQEGLKEIEAMLKKVSRRKKPCTNP